MATIAPTNMQGSGSRAATVTTLDGASDTFEYKNSRGQVLIIENPTAGSLSPVITGADATTVQVNGVGAVDVSTGYSVGSIAAGATVAIPVDSISAYLKGVISIATGTGLECQLLEF